MRRPRETGAGARGTLVICSLVKERPEQDTGAAGSHGGAKAQGASQTEETRRESPGGGWLEELEKARMGTELRQVEVRGEACMHVQVMTQG